MTKHSRHIGLIGLGRMGLGIAGRLTAGGYSVHAFDASPSALQSAEERDLAVVDSIQALAQALPRPRRIWIMVPAGEPVDRVTASLAETLAAGDSVVEGGNSDFRQSIARAERLAAAGIGMLDVGTSGGILGPERGFSLMIGGPLELSSRWTDVFSALAPAHDRGWARVGESGAGHFAKMVHNAVEYGMMQALSEGVALLASEGAPRVDVREALRSWQHGSIVSSTLLDLVAGVVSADDLDRVQPVVADSGHGRNAVRTALERGVAMPIITQALIERFASQDSDQISRRVLSALRGRFGGHAVPGVDGEAS